MVAMGPCAKTTVTAVLVAAGGGPRFEATNAVRNPQQRCPRGHSSARDDYRLCRDVCQQPDHAEEAVLRLAGPWAVGATVWVDHWRVCDRCEQALERAGVRKVELGKPPR